MADFTEGVDGGLDAGREALRRFLAGEDDVATMQAKITLIAAETVPGCDAASITMLRNGKPTTPASTDKLAGEMDELQYLTGDGPCLSAIRHRGAELSRTDDEARWPEFNAGAVTAGVTAVLSTPLVAPEAVVGALNLYSTSAPTYDQEAVSAAALFADQLGVAAVRAGLYAESFELARQLEQALESRAAIDQAKGILMSVQRCTPEEAFDLLRQASQRENRKLHAIAVEIVERYSSRS